MCVSQNAGITDAGVRSLAGGLTNLEALNLSHTHISAAALKEMCRMQVRPPGTQDRAHTASHTPTCSPHAASLHALDPERVHCFCE